MSKTKDVKRCKHRKTERVGIVGNMWCRRCGAISKSIAFGRKPEPEDWTLPKR